MAMFPAIPPPEEEELLMQQMQQLPARRPLEIGPQSGSYDHSSSFVQDGPGQSDLDALEAKLKPQGSKVGNFLAALFLGGGREYRNAYNELFSPERAKIERTKEVLDLFNKQKESEALSQQRGAMADYRRAQAKGFDIKAQDIDPASPKSKNAQERFLKTSQLRRKLIAKRMGDEAAREFDFSPKELSDFSAEDIKLLNDDLDRKYSQMLASSKDIREEELAGAREKQMAASTAVSNAKARKLSAVPGSSVGITLNTKTVPEKVMQAYFDAEKNISALSQAEELYTKVNPYVGLGANEIRRSMSWLRQIEPEDARFQSLFKSIVALKRNKIFGAALSKFDLSDAKTFLADISSSPKEFLVALQTMRDMSQADKQTAHNMYALKTGRKIDEDMQKMGLGHVEIPQMQQTKKLPPDQQKLLNWANKNPGNPKSAEIKKRLGAP